ncbi:unnamed protein product [marine sediment metagenome]|uniref:Uncharacterized protein n=1 Tax=marine sediment metagenome TaxID=412755 RepID=X1PH42_9ZZZZ
MPANPFDDARDYAFNYLEETEGYVPDLLLEADFDYPMTTTPIVDRLIETFFKDEEATNAGTVYPADPKFYTINPVINRLFPYFIDCLQHLDRQDYPPIYRRGPLLLTGLPLRSYSLGERFAYIIITPEEGLNVHDEDNLFLARCYMKRKLVKSGIEVTFLLFS